MNVISTTKNGNVSFSKVNILSITSMDLRLNENYSLFHRQFYSGVGFGPKKINSTL